LLEHEYFPIYSNALRHHLKAPIGDGLRLLEFGCGAGMNLIYAASQFAHDGVPIEVAYGTDFSEALIEEANKERLGMPPQLRDRVKFVVARTETLVQQMAAGLGVRDADLSNSFHLIIGVNTFRYAHRQMNAEVCAQAIHRLLKPGGVCVNIDMNNKFPAFRSRVRDRSTRSRPEYYLPTLAEYRAPFASVGLEILETRNFCWIPHSAGPLLLTACRLATPVLSTFVPSFAMRSLVISRKPV